jgi:hypothetical protein
VGGQPQATEKVDQRVESWNRLVGGRVRGAVGLRAAVFACHTTCTYMDCLHRTWMEVPPLEASYTHFGGAKGGGRLVWLPTEMASRADGWAWATARGVSGVRSRPPPAPAQRSTSRAKQAASLCGRVPLHVTFLPLPLRVIPFSTCSKSHSVSFFCVITTLSGPTSAWPSTTGAAPPLPRDLGSKKIPRFRENRDRGSAWC